MRPNGGNNAGNAVAIDSAALPLLVMGRVSCSTGLGSFV